MDPRTTLPLPALALAAALLVAGCGAARSDDAPLRREAPAPVDPARDSEAPLELELDAFRLGDRVLLLAQGRNRSGAWTTRLERLPDGGFLLVNRPPAGPATSAVTPFEVAAWAPVEAIGSTAVVQVAGRRREVPVRDAPRLGS